MAYRITATIRGNEGSWGELIPELNSMRKGRKASFAEKIFREAGVRI